MKESMHAFLWIESHIRTSNIHVSTKFYLLT